MGNGIIEIAVADAGPLIHLAEIDCLSLLRICAILHIPEIVWAETAGQGRVAEDDVLKIGNIERQYPIQTEVIQFVKDNGLENLHAGERESLYVCQQKGVSLVLTDDLAVRDAAKKLNLTPVGSLGIIIRAYRGGLIALEEAQKYIVNLQDISSLFVTRAIIELAIEELHRRVKES